MLIVVLVIIGGELLFWRIPHMYIHAQGRCEFHYRDRIRSLAFGYACASVFHFFPYSNIQFVPKIVAEQNQTHSLPPSKKINLDTTPKKRYGGTLCELRDHSVVHWGAHMLRTPTHDLDRSGIESKIQQIRNGDKVEQITPRVKARLQQVRWDRCYKFTP